MDRTFYNEQYMLMSFYTTLKTLRTIRNHKQFVVFKTTSPGSNQNILTFLLYLFTYYLCQ